jgi:hypothetical protein
MVIFLSTYIGGGTNGTQHLCARINKGEEVVEFEYTSKKIEG